MASWGSQLGAAVVGGAFCFAAVGKAIEPTEVVASLTYLAGMIDAPPLPGFLAGSRPSWQALNGCWAAG